VVAIEVENSMTDLRKMFADTHLSKILVYRESIDNVIGYVHSYELFKQPQRIRDILLPISIIAETQTAQSVLEEFTRQRRSIAVVVDEFGGTAGLVTMEDIIEEIFGEIEDEHDVEERIEQQINEHEFLFSGRLEIDYLNAEYQLNLTPGETYETLAGYIIHHIEDIPERGTAIQIGGYLFVIESVKGNRIDTIRIMPAPVD
jgi:CBS domain containing-hemolysin-like protein